LREDNDTRIRMVNRKLTKTLYSISIAVESKNKFGGVAASNMYEIQLHDSEITTMIQGISEVLEIGSKL
jgi:hypothetical protein